MGSKQHRVAVLKRLKEAIEKEKDPDRLAKLTAQFVKLNAQKRPRKSAEEMPSVTPIKPGRLSKRTQTGSMVDQLSDAEWLIHDMVLSAEKLCKEQCVKLGRDLTEAEEAAITAEVYATLSDEERAMGEGC